MSDDERLAAIDAVYLEMQDKLQFLRDFNTSTKMLGLQLAKEHNDVTTLRGIYELNN